MVKQILSGHVSPETSRIVDDYPYGGLRCKIRYWLESNTRGTRFCSQTTNPKRGHIWNKAKCSTYAKFGAMYLNEDNHVTWSCLYPYLSADEVVKWSNTFRDGIPAEVLPQFDAFVAHCVELKEKLTQQITDILAPQE